MNLHKGPKNPSKSLFAQPIGHPPDFQAILRPELFNNGNPREEPFSFSVSSIYLLFPWLEAEPSEAAEANAETTVEAAISLNRRTTLCV